MGISKALFRAEQFFDFDLHLPMIVGPAVGGLVLGLIALVEPLVLGMGYATIRETIEGRFGVARAAELAVAKSLALIVTLGSGTSGGLLAPMLLIGASIGSVYGQLVNVLLPSVALNPQVCAIVAMSALFGSAARVPITSFLFGFELTGDYNAILPLMIGCIVADILTYLKVRTFMRLDFHTVTADTPIRDVLAEVRTVSAVQSDFVGGPWDLHPQVWVVVRPDGTTVGYLIDLMLLQAQGRPENLDLPVSTIAETAPSIVYPDQVMQYALVLMLRSGRSWVPVIERDHPERTIGYVTLQDALLARTMNLEDEVLRESIVQPSVFQQGAEVVNTIDESRAEAAAAEPPTTLAMMSFGDLCCRDLPGTGRTIRRPGTSGPTPTPGLESRVSAPMIRLIFGRRTSYLNLCACATRGTTNRRLSRRLPGACRTTKYRPPYE